MRYILLLFLSVFFVSSFWSCQKEDLGNLDGIFTDTLQNGPLPKMTAKIDGKPWTATVYDATIETGKISLTGMDDAGQTIDITILSSAPGDYLLNRGTKHIAAFAPDSITTSFFMSNANLNTGGIVNFSSIDTVNARMSGQFNFIAARSDGTTRTITEGVFSDLNYSNFTINSTFRANKNGFVWNPSKVVPSVTNGVLKILAENLDGSKIILTMPEGVLPSSKSYILSQTGKFTAAYIEGTFTLVPVPLTANLLTIISNDTKTRQIQGTFNFTAKDPVNTTRKGVIISAGVFNLKY